MYGPGPSTTTGLSTNLPVTPAEVIPEVSTMWTVCGYTRPGRCRRWLDLLARLVAHQDGWARPFGDFNHRWLSRPVRADPAGQGSADGRWLGHPLHAATTDIPIGTLLAAVILDLAGQRAAPTSRSSRRSCSCSSPRHRRLADYDEHRWDRPDPGHHARDADDGGARGPARLAGPARRRPDRPPVGGRPRRSSPSCIVTAGAFVGGDVVYVFGNMVSRHAFRGAGTKWMHARSRATSRTWRTSPRRRRPRRGPASTTWSWSGSANGPRAPRRVRPRRRAIAQGFGRRWLPRSARGTAPGTGSRMDMSSAVRRCTTSRPMRSGRGRRRLRGPTHRLLGGAAPRRVRSARPLGHHLGMRPIDLPDPCLVVLIGAAGSGKSTFAARHFGPDEVLSSDAFRKAIRGRRGGPARVRRGVSALHAALSARLSHAGCPSSMQRT